MLESLRMEEVTNMIKIHLSRLLGEHKMTQAELSRITGIRPNAINEMYHEICERINIEYIDLICEALDCKSSDLIEYVPNKIKRVGTDMICKRKKQ
jgi:putative transcriptional regulator